MLHSSRAILALNGTLMMILGGSFWFFPEFFTLSMFPDIADKIPRDSGHDRPEL